jgi:hypothetical protein
MRPRNVTMPNSAFFSVHIYSFTLFTHTHPTSRRPYDHESQVINGYTCSQRDSRGEIQVIIIQRSTKGLLLADFLYVLKRWVTGHKERQRMFKERPRMCLEHRDGSWRENLFTSFPGDELRARPMPTYITCKSVASAPGRATIIIPNGAPFFLSL